MDVRWLDEVDIFLEKEVQFARKLFLSQIPDLGIYERIVALYPHLERSTTESLMMQLRMIKEPEEIEALVKSASKQSGQRIDWHYVGGRACVRAMGDLDEVRTYLQRELDKYNPNKYNI